MYIKAKNVHRMVEERKDEYFSFGSIAPKSIQNRDYTTYIAEHYSELIDFASKLPNIDQTLVGDLINDVWIALNKRECMGNGFDSEYIARSGLVHDVDVAVKNTISSYAKNRRYCKHYNSEVVVSDTEKYNVYSISDALIAGNDDDGDSSTRQSIEVYRQASKQYSVNIEDDYIEKTEHDNEVREALIYGMLSTEDNSISMESLLDNIDNILSTLENENATVSSPDPDGLCRQLHWAMFKEYDFLDDGVTRGKNTPLVESFRTVLRECAANKENLMRLFRETKLALAQ